MASELEIEIGRKLKEVGGEQAAVRELGYSKTSVSRVATKIKGGWDPNAEVKPPGSSELETVPSGKDSQEQRDGSKPKAVVPAVRSPIEVGKITITPENWGMTQYGAILILDTYNKAKRDLDYDGTIGDFLCDMCEFSRRVANYKEVEYAKTASEGGDGHKEDVKEGSGAGTGTTGD